MGKSSKFVAGAVLGAVAAMLLTPVAGKKVREQVKKLAKRAGIDADALGKHAQQLVQAGAKFAASASVAKQAKTKTKKRGLIFLL